MILFTFIFIDYPLRCSVRLHSRARARRPSPAPQCGCVMRMAVADDYDITSMSGLVCGFYNADAATVEKNACDVDGEAGRGSARRIQIST